MNSHTATAATGPTPARRPCWWIRRATAIAVIVLAATVITALSAVAGAHPSTPPPAPAPGSPVGIVTPPVQPAVPAPPLTTSPVAPSPANPNPGTPSPVTPPEVTPGPDSPNPRGPNPAFPGGVDPNPVTPAPAIPALPGDPDPNAPSAPDSPGDQQPECGLTNITGCVSKAIDGWFQSLVSSALNPLLSLLSSTLLTTPDPRTLPQVGVLWNSSWQLVVVLYGLVVMAAGLLLMAHQTLQARWSVRELAPRLVLGFLAGAFSMLIATTAIRIANALARAVGGTGADPEATAKTVRQLAGSIQDPQAGTFVILLEVAMVVMLLIVLISYVVRVVITILLIVAAPLALMCHALPGADAVARWWWRSFASALAIQVVQSLILVTVLRVLLTPGGWAMFSVHATGLVDRIIALGLMGVLAKTPFWLLSTLKLGHGRSLPESLIRSYISYKTLGLINSTGSAPAAAAARNTTKPPRRSVKKVAAQRGLARGTKTEDPYAKVRATRDGQLMLPLDGVRRVPHKPAPAPASTPEPKPTARRAPQGRQLAFDFRPPDPYRGIRAGRDGQYRLPIPAARTPKPQAPPAPTPAPRTRVPARERGKQLAFEFTPPDPYARIRPMRNGQYPLPIRVARVRPAPAPGPGPATPPQPPAPGSAKGSSPGRQLHLPLPDLPVRRRTPKAGGSR